MSRAMAETVRYLDRLVGSDMELLRKIAGKLRLSFWTLHNIKIGRAKGVDADLRDTIRDYFIKNCREHAARLLHEAEIAERAGRNDDLASLADQIRAYASELDTAAREGREG